MRNRAFRLMLRIAVIIPIILSMVLGGGFNVRPDGRPHFGTSVALAAGENWLGTWQNRTRISVDYSKIGSTLTNFPVLIHISSSSGINSDDLTPVFDELATDANRKKIAVTTSDGITQCYVEIERWDSANIQAWLWVKIPTVSNTADTVLYLYYDATQPDNTTYVGDTGSTPAQNVWDTNYIAVYHLQESGAGIVGEYKDSTINHHDGQGGTGVAQDVPSRVAGNIGFAQSFDGVNDFIQIADSDAFSITTTNALTISVWISPHNLNMAGATDYVRWMGKGENSAQQEWQFVYYDQEYTPRPQWVSFYNYSPSGGQGAGDYSTGSVAQDSWVRILARVTCTDATHGVMQIHRNDLTYTGAADDWQSYGLTYANGTAPVRIGRQYVGGGYWNGRIGEVRFSNIKRSNEWEFASYYSEMDQLLYYSSVGTTTPGKQVSYETGDTSGGASHDKTLVTQTFTTVDAFTITSVKLKLYAASTSTAGIVRIKAIDGSGKPTGGDLCTGAIHPSSLVATPGSWVEVPLGSGAVLSAATQYAIILDCSDPIVPIYWRIDPSSPLYTGGKYGESTSGGTTWTMYSGIDAAFEVWGITLTTPPTNIFDLNGDARVNVLDMILVGQHQGQSGTPGWIPEDVNTDGIINVLDQIQIGQHWTG